MYPSGPWKGFWHQDGFGRQEMEQFELHFSTDGTVRGQGSDMVGVFTFRGHYEPANGTILMTKQYLGKHTVEYAGRPDGEGKIVGEWNIREVWRGPFSLHPVVGGDLPIQEIVR